MEVIPRPGGGGMRDLNQVMFPNQVGQIKRQIERHDSTSSSASSVSSSTSYSDTEIDNEEDYESDMFDDEPSSLRSLTLLMEHALRLAKKQHLSCGEVLLPPTLLTRVARDAMRMAETEPCGLRGALIILYFQEGGGETNNNDKKKTSGGGGRGPIEIGRIQLDPSAVATFQLHLTLQEEEAPWYARLSQILMRGWNRTGMKPTLIVSPGYTLAKKKLYRSPSPSVSSSRY